MIEYLIYDSLFLFVYIYVSTWICRQEKYTMKGSRFYKEVEKGTLGLLKQLPMSNVILHTVMPYTRLTNTFSIIACFQYLLFFDFLVFCIHVLLHSNRTIYNLIHKEHHRTIYVVPFSATILDNKEYLCTGMIPTILPLFFIDIDLIGWTMINIFIFIHGLFIHSTYELPYEKYLLGSQNHSIHHVKKSVNFGFLLPIWDYIFGTRTYQKRIKNMIHRYYDNKTGNY